jgi:hypothetical protein
MRRDVRFVQWKVGHKEVLHGLILVVDESSKGELEFDPSISVTPGSG